MNNKTIVVVHSGGMDSSICLALAIKKYGEKEVVSLSFNYGQRHATELVQAAKICQDWSVDHTTLTLSCLEEITENALTHKNIPIEHSPGSPPSTLVVGRNGLFAHLAGIYAHQLGANEISLGVLEREEANSGYRDCSRAYMDLQQQILRVDTNSPSFLITTPLIQMSKKQTHILAQELGIYEYLIKNTISCYNGLPYPGCMKCPACAIWGKE